MQVWRNWQTRMVQVHMNASSCRFKSCYLHQTECSYEHSVFSLSKCRYEHPYQRTTIADDLLSLFYVYRTHAGHMPGGFRLVFGFLTAAGKAHQKNRNQESGHFSSHILTSPLLFIYHLLFTRTPSTCDPP